jgi:uncharacterized protein involved in exopolysaccharide biosynthesis
VSSPESQPNDEVTLQDYGRVVTSGWKIILVAALAAAVVGLALTFIRTTTYSASSQVFLGQATTIAGVPVTTPPTNPATAPAVLEGDAIVDPVAARLGISRGRVRSGISLDVPRAPGSAGNLPTLVKVTFTDSERELARAAANLYAGQIVAYNGATFLIGQETYEAQLKRNRAEEKQLRAQVTRLQKLLEDSAGTPRESAYQLSLSLANQRLTETLTNIEDAELTLANQRQIEQPRVVTKATDVSSSTSGPRRVRTVVFAALLGAIVGLIVVFIWYRPRSEGA